MISRYLTLNSHLTVDQIREKIKLRQCSMLEAMVCRGMIMAYVTGDTHRIDFFFERLIGKVPNKIEHSKPDPFEGKTIEELRLMKLQYEEANRRSLNYIEQNSERVKQQERDVIEIVNQFGNGEPLADIPTTPDDSTGT